MTKVRSVQFIMSFCSIWLFLALGGAAQDKPTAIWRLVERVEYDWNQDGKPDEFILECGEDCEGETFATRLTIRISGPKAILFHNDLSWTAFAEDAILRAWSTKNVVSSRYLLFMPMKADNVDRVILFVFGWAYGSSPGSFHVIDLAKTKTPKVILFLKEFELTDFVDLDGDAIPEVVGKPCLSQMWGDLLTYDPFHVYVLPQKGGKARFSLRLTKEYNLAHYYGWAGPNCSEELAVVLHPPGGGKPVIMKAKDARKLPEQD